MVLKILRYLGQQGYGTDKVVILTPYLGQLRALRDALKKDNDPILNDLDSADLVRAGLMTPSAARVVKKPIRLATIGMLPTCLIVFLLIPLQTTIKGRRVILSSHLSLAVIAITTSDSCLHQNG